MHHIRFANGTSALYAALVALDCHGDDIAVPSTICPSVICAIFASGNRPYFVDIERERLGMHPEHLSTVVDQVAAVIAVHALGTPCEISKIAAMCQRAGVPLIEDCCQSQGADHDGQAVGVFGDVAIYSFGAGKIIEIGGGGAAETKEATLATRISEIADSLPESDENAARDLGLSYKFYYNQFYPHRLQHHQSSYTAMLRETAPGLLGKYSFAMDVAIDAALAGLNHNIAERRRKARLYEEQLEGVEGIRILNQTAGAVPWRFNLWLEFPLRQFILKRMLEEKRAVSSWSPDISQFMLSDSYRSTTLEHSRWLGDGILNLWLDGDTDERQILETCHRLRQLVTEFNLSEHAQKVEA